MACSVAMRRIHRSLLMLMAGSLERERDSMQPRRDPCATPRAALRRCSGTARGQGLPMSAAPEAQSGPAWAGSGPRRRIAMAATPFRPAVDLMSQYAQYHRDKRNIVTHFVGIPLIVFALGILLARASIGGFTLAWTVWILSTAWYLTRGNLVLGVATSVVNALLIWLAHPFAGVPLVPWLAWGIGFFVLGWIIQFIGHYYEGRKPAFVDDIVGLLVGPMFVVG